ncbi:MAG: shikimate kinase [Mesorhizobium sp.]
MSETKGGTQIPPDRRPVVLVGMMGAGKSVVGRCLARRLGLEFRDSDGEIEMASRMSIPDLFALYGEAEFRALEHRVIRRLLRQDAIVLATGGGAFANDVTRAEIEAAGVSVWLRADLDTLYERVSRRSHRPLLQAEDPRAVLAGLLAAREPTYAQADITVATGSQPLSVVVDQVLEALAKHRMRAAGSVRSKMSSQILQIESRSA